MGDTVVSSKYMIDRKKFISYETYFFANSSHLVSFVNEIKISFINSFFEYLFFFKKTPRVTCEGISGKSDISFFRKDCTYVLGFLDYFDLIPGACGPVIMFFVFFILGGKFSIFKCR